MGYKELITLDRPILTPKTVLPIFFAIGIIFAPIGGLLLWSSAMVSPGTRTALQMLRLRHRFKSFLLITPTAVPSRRPTLQTYPATNTHHYSNPPMLRGQDGWLKNATKFLHTESSKTIPVSAPCYSIFQMTLGHLFSSTTV